MNVKTFKIGEYAKGGVITVEIKGWANDLIAVIGKDWDASQGWSRGSNQSNAKEFTRKEVKATDYNAERELDNFLCDLTTSYYAGQILDWIKTKTKFQAAAGGYYGGK
jgi:hypothetical protein